MRRNSTRGFARPRPEPKRPLDVLLQAFSIARSYRFLVEAAAPPPDVDLICLPGVDPGHIRRDDFSQSQALMDRARALAGQYGARFVDLSTIDSFGGDPKEFYDVVHPTVVNTR